MSGLSMHRGGSGDPLVLIHGLGSHLRAWEPVLPLLAARREVIALDLPGFGKSPLGPTTVPGLADSVEAELGRLGIERPHFAGNSMGGWISLELAKRGLARTVVALSPAGMWTGPREALSRVRLVSSYFLCKAGARAGERPFRNPKVRRALLRTYQEHGERTSAADAAAGTRNLAQSKGFLPLWRWTLNRNAEGLEQIRCPVLIAWGDRDRLLNKRQAPRFVERIPGAELKMLPGLGHVPMGDDPELVARTILEFEDRAAAVSPPEGAAAP